MIREPKADLDPEAIAIAALGWIAEDRDRLGRFMMLTGLRPDRIRMQAAEPGFLLGVLNQVLAWEPWLTEFAAAAEVDVEGRGPAAAVRKRTGGRSVYRLPLRSLTTWVLGRYPNPSDRSRGSARN